MRMTISGKNGNELGYRFLKKPQDVSFSKVQVKLQNLWNFAKMLLCAVCTFFNKFLSVIYLELPVIKFLLHDFGTIWWFDVNFNKCIVIVSLELSTNNQV